MIIPKAELSYPTIIIALFFPFYSTTSPSLFSTHLATVPSTSSGSARPGVASIPPAFSSGKDTLRLFSLQLSSTPTRLYLQPHSFIITSTFASLLPIPSLCATAGLLQPRHLGTFPPEIFSPYSIFIDFKAHRRAHTQGETARLHNWTPKFAPTLPLAAWRVVLHHRNAASAISLFVAPCNTKKLVVTSAVSPCDGLCADS